MQPRKSLGAAAIVVVAAVTVVGARMSGMRGPAPLPLPTGKVITPVGAQTAVGSFPVAMALSPDGKWIAVTETGYREHLSILSAATGKLVSQISYGSRGTLSSLYVGVAFVTGGDGKLRLYASRGPEDRVSIYNISPEGTISISGNSFKDPSALPRLVGGNFIAGFAVSGNGTRVYLTHNMTSEFTDEKGSLSVMDGSSANVLGTVQTPGFPFAAVAVTKGPNAEKKIYVSSERDGVVSIIDVRDPAVPKLVKNIPTGDHPIALLLDRSQRRLFVANASSDTISIVDTATDRVIDNLLLRPAGAHGLPGATPTGLALSPDEKRLYVTLADLNALAVVDVDRMRLESRLDASRILTGGGTGMPRARKITARIEGPSLSLLGYVPTGWYPTSVVVSADGKRIFVANAKGVDSRIPNNVKRGPNGEWGDYIENIMEGTVSVIPIPTNAELRRMNAQVIANNRITGDLAKANVGALQGLGIAHVIYIVKENRTYDQILGDVPSGNGDPSQTLFGRDVTPNQHALAERFVLLDNFYVCGEVSADGWTWSTQGMANEYAQRNVPFNYSGRGRYYDFEGQNNGAPVDLLGIPDVARSPGGYIWDDCVKSHVPFRNYGFFVSIPVPFGPHGPLAKDNAPTKKALLDTTDPNFYRFDLGYADSEAWVKLDAPAGHQRKHYGKFDAPCRYTEWKREFDAYVVNGNLPPFEMVRFCRDHTQGTVPGYASPRAMVADNDYAVGQLVEAVSHSPYWKDTAIFIIEDDAQDGHDHVDCHRSSCYVISPHIKASTVDHRFYNTDSVLRSMEALLGMPPMNETDAVAPLFAFLTPDASNDAPYDAILPAKAIGGEMNGRDAYRSKDSEKLDFTAEDRVPPGVLNDILWHSVKGRNVPEPPIRNAGRPGSNPDRD